jgi:hypothetical protein
MEILSQMLPEQAHIAVRLLARLLWRRDVIGIDNRDWKEVAQLRGGDATRDDFTMAGKDNLIMWGAAV